MEHRIAKIWQEVLSIPNVHPADDFFSLGGSSLSAVRIVSFCRGQLWVCLQHFWSNKSRRKRVRSLLAALKARVVAFLVSSVFVVAIRFASC